MVLDTDLFNISNSILGMLKRIGVKKNKVAIREVSIGEINSKKTKLPALLKSSNIIIKQCRQDCFIPKRIENMIKEIWEFQIKLLKFPPKSKLIFSHRRFRAGYDFLLLREEVGVNLGGAGKWWKENQPNFKRSYQNK